ncbi:MAG: NADH-quinone oxidoreductase subunit M, partial [Phototrophicales bacterium]
FFKSEQKDLIRGIAIAAAGAVFILSLFVFLNYNNQVSAVVANQEALIEAGGTSVGTQMFKETLAFEENVSWISSLGINYHLAVDGLSAPMVLLTGMVAVAGVLVSWRIEDRTREFMAFFLLLVAGVYGVFVAVDLFVLFFFYELAIFPMYLLIATWGWAQLREYAAMKLTLYILVGSVVALVGVIAMVITA